MPRIIGASVVLASVDVVPAFWDVAFESLNQERKMMLDPYFFSDEIKRTANESVRCDMARLALNLYFDPVEFPFDVSGLHRLGPVSKLKCLGALAWVHSQERSEHGHIKSEIGGENFIDVHLKKWLVNVSAGMDPLKAPPC